MVFKEWFAAKSAICYSYGFFKRKIYFFNKERKNFVIKKLYLINVIGHFKDLSKKKKQSSFGQTFTKVVENHKFS